MFGNNPVRKRSDYTPGQYRVQSIFKTIQGEGPFVGRPCVFVRLAGCNLRCFFCDTDFESGFNNVMSTANLLYEVRRQAGPAGGPGGPGLLVVITGGEPMLQDLSPFIWEVTSAGGHVQIETAGTLWNKEMDSFSYQQPGLNVPEPGAVSIVVSPKTTRMHPGIEARAIAFKYIVAQDDTTMGDGLPFKHTQKQADDVSMVQGQDLFVPVVARPSPTWDNRRIPIYVQPQDTADPEQNKKNANAAINSSLRFGYTLSVQVHKVVGLE